MTAMWTPKWTLNGEVDTLRALKRVILEIIQHNKSALEWTPGRHIIGHPQSLPHKSKIRDTTTQHVNNTYLHNYAKKTGIRRVLKDVKVYPITLYLFPLLTQRYKRCRDFFWTLLLLRVVQEGPSCWAGGGWVGGWEGKVAKVICNTKQQQKRQQQPILWSNLLFYATSAADWNPRE